jgi:hypothetical protein
MGRVRSAVPPGMSKEWNPVFPPQRRVSARRIRDLAELRRTHRLKYSLALPGALERSLLRWRRTTSMIAAHTRVMALRAAG